MNPTVTLKDTSSAALATLASKVKDKDGLLRVLGRRTANELRAHFRGLEQTRPNKQGFPRSHFWADVAQSVFVNIPGKTSVRVGIGNVAIAQKLYGGTIRAKRAKNLALPLSSEAYGSSPREAKWRGRLRWQPTSKPGVGLLVEKGKDGPAHFLLVKTVTQKADPSVLPDMPQLGAKLAKSAAGFIGYETAKAASKPPQIS